MMESYYYNMEHPNEISDLVTPYLKIFNWALLVPSKIEFDDDRKAFICKKGSPLARILSYIWLMFMTVYMSLIFFNDVDAPPSIKVIISKITWASYTLFDAALIKCLRNDLIKIAHLLTEGDKIASFCNKLNHLDDRKQKNNFSQIVWIMIFLGLTFTVVFVCFVIVDITASTTNLYSIFMEFKSKNGVEGHCHLESVLCNLFYKPTSNCVATILLTLWLVMAYSVELIWVIFLMMAASFGYYYKTLLSACIDIIEKHQIELSEGIFLHTRITILLEDFNNIFGMALLWIVLASLMYKASILGDFLAGSTNNGILYDIVNIMSTIPFCAMLYFGSEVHRTGNKLPKILRRKFLQLESTNRDQAIQILHGTNAVYYDSLSKNVGFKGLGFFTISYTFVASLSGFLITYSLVVLQLQTILFD